MPTNETLRALQQAVEGLTYQSETDAPWTAFAWPTATGEPTGEGVKQLGRHKADAPVEEQTVEEFFDPLMCEQDWYGDEERATAAKYRGLLKVVKLPLQRAKVVRIRERNKSVYVIGLANEGGWAGLQDGRGGNMTLLRTSVRKNRTRLPSSPTKGPPRPLVGRIDKGFDLQYRFDAGAAVPGPSSLQCALQSWPAPSRSAA